jgi:organic hydroperoxide reductase OsmC/OhrA
MTQLRGDEDKMATHVAAIKWAAKESPEEVLKGRFSRAHSVSFDGGTEIPASASPHVVGKWAVEAAVDPEEMLVASLSSCHMLSFLHLARMAGFAVRSYDDDAEGTTAEIAPGRLAMTKVKLRPKIEWAGAAPSKEALDRLHHQAHEICFIANSVKTQVTVE